MPEGRIDRLKKAVQEFRPGVCTERAMIWTDYFRKKENRSKSIYIQIAEALRDVLLKKTIRIYGWFLFSFELAINYLVLVGRTGLEPVTP